MGKTLLTGHKGDIGSILFDLYTKSNQEIEPLDVKVDRPAKRIIHLAARTPPASTQMMLDSNIFYLQEVIKYAVRNGAKELIFFSTISVYGKQDKEDVGEDEKPCDPDLYGLTKLIGEKLLQDSQLNVLCLRLPAILGNRNTTSFMSRCFETLKNNEALEISNAHRTYNNFISAENLFEFLEKVEISRKFDVVNLASKKEKTVLEIAETIKGALNSKSDIMVADKKRGFFNISTRKAENEYGFVPYGTKNSLNSWVRQRTNKC